MANSHDPDLLARFWRDVVLAVRLMFDRRVSGAAKLIPAAMVAYILSPIDLIPEVFLPFGVVDDITALLVGLQLFIHSAPPDIVAEYRQGRSEQPAAKNTHIENTHIIEGQYTIRKDE